MATSRYSNRRLINDDNFLLEKKLFNKGVESFIHYESPKIVYPDIKKIQDLNTIKHIWKQGDSFEKLSFTYYNDSSYWWVIATFNQKPTEQHYLVGDSIYIPLPIYKILTFLGY